MSDLSVSKITVNTLKMTNGPDAPVDQRRMKTWKKRMKWLCANAENLINILRSILFNDQKSPSLYKHV